MRSETEVADLKTKLDAAKSELKAYLDLHNTHVNLSGVCFLPVPYPQEDLDCIYGTEKEKSGKIIILFKFLGSEGTYIAKL